MVNHWSSIREMVQADIVLSGAENIRFCWSIQSFRKWKIIEFRRSFPRDRQSTMEKHRHRFALKWNLQHGFLPLSKSVNEDRMRANLEVENFEIAEKI